ncbi:MAG: hypothetical protein NC394_08335 [Bacteroides sp.]|nr:hypothetical protein [Bacteroides sp.]
MASHSFSFDGGEILSKIGATWFVSYAYYEKIDGNHNNWKNVSSRFANYNNSRNYHKYWLEQVLVMNSENLKRNKLGIDPDTTKAMAKKLLEQWDE